MTTHIIIPIKDIELQIKTLSQQLEEEKNKTNPDGSHIDYLIHEIDFLSRLSRSPKQISLDEKDIDSLILPHDSDEYEKGYKQALKDLL